LRERGAKADVSGGVLGGGKKRARNYVGWGIERLPG